MAGEAAVGASGMVAAWLRPLMAATLANATADPLRKFRRESFMSSILLYSALAPLLVAAITASGSESRVPPSMATLRSVEASQKFRLASMPATLARDRSRAVSSSTKASTCMALYCSSVSAEMVSGAWAAPHFRISWRLHRWRGKRRKPRAPLTQHSRRVARGDWRLRDSAA